MKKILAITALVALGFCCLGFQEAIVIKHKAAASGPTFIASVSGCSYTGASDGCGTATGTTGATFKGGPHSNGTLDVLAGDELYAFVRSGGSNNTFTFCSGASCPTSNDTFSATTHSNDANVGNTQIGYVCSASAHSGETFTVTNSNSANNNLVIVIQVRGGAGGTCLDQQKKGGITGNLTATSASFTTTSAAETIIMCGGTDGLASNVISSGLIGGVSSTLIAAPETDITAIGACEYLIVSSIQTTITAAMSISGTAPDWNYSLGTFK
jgi:hypothetical protein